MNYYEKMEKALELLIESCAERRDSQWDRRSSYDSKNWLKEYCTVKLSGARQTGHTSAMFSFVRKNPDKKFCVLAVSQRMCDYYQSITKDLDNVVLSSVNVFDYFDYDYVFVDVASFVDVGVLEDLDKWLVKAADVKKIIVCYLQ